MNLFKFRDQIINKDIFLKALKPFIKNGDFIYLEIDLMSFGNIFDVNMNKKDFLEEFYILFRNLVGEEGHIACPSFSYSWGDDKEEKIFDVANTPGEVGLFPEFLRKNKKILRTKDPMFSVIINGVNRDAFDNIENNSFGNGSFFHKIHKKNAKLISFGLKSFDPTFVHYCEQYFDENINKISYRKNKKFIGYLVENSKKELVAHYSFMRKRDLNLRFSDKKLRYDLLRTGDLNVIKIGNGKIFISDCQSVFNTCIKQMKSDCFYLVEKFR